MGFVHCIITGEFSREGSNAVDAYDEKETAQLA